MADAGKAMMLYKGVYDSTIEYEILDVVNYNGSLYISKINNNLDYEPTLDETKWQLFLEGGTSENIKVTDTQGIVGDAGSSSFVQTLLDGIAEKVVNIISGSEVVKKATQAETATKATQDGNGNNIVNTYVNKSKILDTAELISANTASGNVAGALAVKTINNNLKNSLSKIGNIYTGKSIEITISGAYLEEPISEYITLPSGTYIFVINYRGDIAEGRYLILTLTENADNGEYYHINNWFFNGKPANAYGKDSRTFAHVAKLSNNNRKYNVRIGTNWQSDTDVNKASATLTAIRIA